MMLEGDPEIFTSSLKGKRVVIGITASISIYRVPDIIRDLRREGADVIAGMSREACDMISPEVFRWATGNEVVTHITGDIEHVGLFQGRADDTMLLVCPASYNFIGKAASGISDDVPSLFFSFALGNGNPIAVSPVMHEGMMVNPFNRENIRKLENAGVSIIPPRIESDKAKISDSDKIIDYVSKAFDGRMLGGKNILVIGGRGEERVDPVRRITNSGTGFTAKWFLRNAFRLGADTISFVGNCSSKVPDYVEHRHALSFEEFRKGTEELLESRKFDAVINVASLPDFSVEENFEDKIDSASPVVLHLKPLEKLNRWIRGRYRGVLVTFKLENRFDLEETKKNIKDVEPDIVVFNPYTSDKEPFGSVENQYTMLKGGEVTEMGKLSKPEMTLKLLEQVSGLLN